MFDCLRGVEPVIMDEEWAVDMLKNLFHMYIYLDSDYKLGGSDFNCGYI